MSHQDIVSVMPRGFKKIASSQIQSLQLLQMKIKNIMEYNFIQKLVILKMVKL